MQVEAVTVGDSVASFRFRFWTGPEELGSRSALWAEHE
jgi:hypothetical protein